MSRNLAPVLAILVAGFVYSVLPHGVFGTHDVVARAAICGATAALTILLMRNVPAL
jgi:hypothetical protein